MSMTKAVKAALKGAPIAKYCRSGIPPKVVPEGWALVHNHVYPDGKNAIGYGTNGSRCWLTPRSYHRLRRCRCSFAPGRKHYTFDTLADHQRKARAAWKEYLAKLTPQERRKALAQSRRWERQLQERKRMISAAQRDAALRSDQKIISEEKSRRRIRRGVAS